jgi:hypothetical protein
MCRTRWRQFFRAPCRWTPRARQRHAGIFWNELVAALEQAAPVAKPRAIELADDLEFDPSSLRKLPSQRASAPYSVPFSAPSRPPAARPGVPAAPLRVALASAPFIVPDLELTPPPVSRRLSGERPVVQVQPNLIELDSSSMPAALELELVLPAEEARGQGPKSQRLVAAQPSTSQPSTEQRRSNPPPRSLSGSMAATQNEPLLGAPTSGVMLTRHSTPPPSPQDSSRDARHSRPPASADVRAPFETGFVAKIEARLPEEPSLGQRLRPAIALLAAAILIAIFDPIYAAATGEVLEIVGQRLSLFAGALLLLALGLAARAVLLEP